MSVAPSADAGGNIKIKNVISGLGGTPEDAEIISALHRMDKDGDGTISVIDLVHIANTRVKNEKKIQNLKRLVLIVVLLSLVVCGVMLGLMLAANEASKDTKPEKSGLMKTTGGEPVSVEAAEDSMELVMLPYADIDVLQALTTMTVSLPDGEIKHYSITGFSLKGGDSDTPELILETARGDKIKVVDGAVSLHLADGTEVPVEEKFGSSRKLLQAAASTDTAAAATAVPKAAVKKMTRKTCKRKCIGDFMATGPDYTQVGTFNVCLAGCRKIPKGK